MDKTTHHYSLHSKKGKNTTWASVTQQGCHIILCSYLLNFSPFYTCSFWMQGSCRATIKLGLLTQFYLPNCCPPFSFTRDISGSTNTQPVSSAVQEKGNFDLPVKSISWSTAQNTGHSLLFLNAQNKVGSYKRHSRACPQKLFHCPITWRYGVG